ncbi:MAG TPA: ubiquitin-like protein Pup [Methylomirabilota bacterium]|jgi:ubiquitin-like protein Pup|nr:ubiquitin-like protein Pup [Methylomirabilota bacterium]
MAEQERKGKRSTEGEAEQKPPPSGSGATLAERASKIKKDIDELIEDIDEVLEDNAEEFVKSYVQRGGQ